MELLAAAQSSREAEERDDHALNQNWRKYEKLNQNWGKYKDENTKKADFSVLGAGDGGRRRRDEQILGLKMQSTLCFLGQKMFPG